jgi:hypothetical protein
MDPTARGRTEEDLGVLEEDEDYFDIDELIDFSHDELEDWDEPMAEDEPSFEAPIANQNTQYLRARLEGADVLSKVKRVISCMQAEGLNLPLFLDAVFYGDLGCHNDAVVRYQRTALMVSDELPGLLDRWYQPPSRSEGHQGQRPLAARKVLISFAKRIVNEEIDREIKRTAKFFVSRPELLSKEHLLSLDFHAMLETCRMYAPTLWHLFRNAAYTAEQDKHNIRKNPDMVSTTTSIGRMNILTFHGDCPFNDLSMSIHALLLPGTVGESMGHLFESLRNVSSCFRCRSLARTHHESEVDSQCVSDTFQECYG